MTIWSPQLSQRSGPLYLAIADLLDKDFTSGALKPGDRLPTHRDLAWKLGVTVGTITRAYAEARRRGVISGEVGRGTFIRERQVDVPPRAPAAVAEDEFVDLARNFPTEGIADAAVARAITEAASGDITRLLTYTDNVGLAEHREAALQWLSGAGVEAGLNEVAITAGAQHAMTAAMAALTRPDDVVLTEHLTFYGMKSLATLLSLRLHGVAMDHDGLSPEALDAACRLTGAKVLYCIPTLQNPTASIMSSARRAEIAAVCRRHDVTIVEDDIYGFLSLNGPKPLATFAPDISIYVTSLSKCICPGMRIGYLRAPAPVIERIGSAVRATSFMAAPVMVEAAARLIRSGEATRLAMAQRDEAIARQRIVTQHLGAFDIATDPASMHVWLKMPEPWRREEFAAQARRRGVGVTPAEAFAVGRAPVPHAVRLGLSAPRERATLDRALGVLAALLREPPGRGVAMV